MNKGWIKLHRKVMEQSFWKKSAYVHLWMHLLLKANHEEIEFEFNGKAFDLKAGQFVTGRTSISADTRIPGSTVERILKFLESEHLIGQQKTNKYRVITIVNWSRYQAIQIKSGQQDEQQHPKIGQQSGQQSGHIQEVIKKIKKNKNYDSDFDLLWAIYPRRLGRKDAFRHFKASVKTEGDIANIKIALNNFIAYIKAEKTEEKYISHGSTWFNNWEDWIEKKVSKGHWASVSG